MDNSSPQLSPIKFLNSYSILVALGAGISFVFFAKLYGAGNWLISAICLSVSTWVIYTADHILDGRNVDTQIASLRHVLHVKHFKPLTLLAVLLVFLILTIGTVYLPIFLLKAALIIAGFTMVHFGFNFFLPKHMLRKLFLKEVSVAFIVMLATVFLPLSLVTSSFPELMKSIDMNTALVFLIMFFINLTNLVLFSFYDFEEDEANELLSVATVYGKQRIKKVILALLLVIAVILIRLITIAPEMNGFLLGFMVLSLLVLSVISFSPTRWFQKNERYRFWGDIIYVLPSFALPFL